MRKDSLKYSLAVILFGTIGMFLRWISLPSEIVVLLRGVIGALVVFLVILCNRKIRGMDAFDKVIVQLAVSALTVLPYALIKNLGTPLVLDVRSILLTLMLGLVHTGFAYCLYLDNLGKLPVHSVAVLGYLEPVVSVLCSALILKEHMTVLGWIGAALIIGAAAASELIKE